MTLNHLVKYIFCAAVLLVSKPVAAQSVLCTDTVKHQKLRDAMWATCSQEDPHKVYAACWAYQSHCMECKDNAGY